MSDSNGQADVLIIGAGASGSVVAWRLAQAGMKVVCLEQGGWLDKDDYPHRRNDWELQRQRDFNLDPNERMRPEDYPLNVDDSPINPLMFNAVGGSTIHWSGHFPRFKPSDFRVKTLDGVADDWPLDYWELEPYYDRNDALVGVTGLAGDPANPPRSGPLYAPAWTRPCRRGLRPRLRKIGMALVAGRLGPLIRAIRRTPRVQQLRSMRSRLSHGSDVERPRHLLAQGCGSGSPARYSCASAGNRCRQPRACIRSALFRRERRPPGGTSKHGRFGV